MAFESADRLSRGNIWRRAALDHIGWDLDRPHCPSDAGQFRRVAYRLVAKELCPGTLWRISEIVSGPFARSMPPC